MKKIAIVLCFALAFTALAWADPFQLNQKYEFIQQERALARAMLDLNAAYIAVASTWTEMGYSSTLTQEDIDAMPNLLGLSKDSLTNLIAAKAGWDTYFVAGNIIDVAESIK